MSFLPRPRSLHSLARDYGVPPPADEGQTDRLLDRWEADLAAKLALAAPALAVATLGAIGLVGAAFPRTVDGTRVVALAIQAGASLFGIFSGVSALGLTLRAAQGEASLWVKVGVPAALVVCTLLLFVAGAAFLLTGLS